MIEIKAGTVNLTEQTIRELLWAIEEAKKVTKFTDEPLPDGDMGTDTLVKLKRERGTILVKSFYSNIEFSISLEIEPHTQESMGYKLI